MGQVVIDKLLGKPLMHRHNGTKFTYFLMKDADNNVWQVTVDTSGNLTVVPYDTYIITQSGAFLRTESDDFLVL